MHDRVGQQIGGLSQRRDPDLWPPVRGGRVVPAVRSRRLGLGDVARFGSAVSVAASVAVTDGQEWRLPQRERDAAAGGTVVGHRRHIEPGQPRRGGSRIADRRGGEQEDRGRSVARADATKSADDVRDMRAEDAAVGVALVDHDEAQSAQERRPVRVPWQDAAVHHVRIGEHEARIGPYPFALLPRRVAVVDGGTDIGRRNLAQRAQLVGGERLRRREVERGRPRIRSESGQHRQVVGERFAGRGPGRDDHVAASVGEVGGGRLVRPRTLDATRAQRRAEIRRNPRRPVGVRSGPGRHPLDVGEAVESARQPAEQFAPDRVPARSNP